MTDITLEGITKVYGSGPAAVTGADAVDLSIDSGELFFLLGPSGCGKTTLLRIIAGLVEPTAGRVLFDGREVTALPVEKRNTAMVFQNYALWPHMTVRGNVEFGPKMRGAPRRERRELARANLGRVQMVEYARRRPNELSGGQQQRVAVARALAARPACLLLDEPLSNLDARLRSHMRGELRTLVKDTGTTAVYVTHDQKEALSMADRIAVINDGRVVQIGRPEELYNRPATRFVADFLGETNFIEGRVVRTEGGAEVQTGVGTLPVRPPAEAAEGQAVTCSVRPERIRLGLAPQVPGARSESCVTLPATVESVTYLGEARQYACRLANGALWKVLLFADAADPLPPGRRVQLGVKVEDVSILTA